MSKAQEQALETLRRLDGKEITFQQALDELRTFLSNNSVDVHTADFRTILSSLESDLSREEFRELAEFLNSGQDDKTIDQTIDHDLNTTQAPNDVVESHANSFQPKQDNDRYERIESITRPNGKEYWLARDLNANRQVLLQPIDAQEGDTVHAGQLVGGLEHPNIAPVYSIISGGEQSGIVYRFNSGESFTQWIKKAPKSLMALRQSVQLVISICDALAFAHSRNIAHRSVTPDNVIVGEFHEVQLETWDYANADGDLDYQTEDVIGVLGFISLITDIFANTHKIPNSDLAILKRISDCVSSDGRASAYESIVSLKGDLTAWLHRSPLKFVKEPLRNRVVRFTRKHRKPVYALITLMIVAAITAIYTGAGIHEARVLLDETNDNLQRQYTALSEQVDELDKAIKEADQQREHAIAAAALATEQKEALATKTEADDKASDELHVATIALDKQAELSRAAKVTANSAAQKARDAEEAAREARLTLNQRLYESREIQARDFLNDAIQYRTTDRPSDALLSLRQARLQLADIPDTPQLLALKHEVNSVSNQLLERFALPGEIVSLQGSTLAVRFSFSDDLLLHIAVQNEHTLVESISPKSMEKQEGFVIPHVGLFASLSENLSFVSVVYEVDSNQMLSTYSRDTGLPIHTVSIENTVEGMRVSNAGDVIVATSNNTLTVITGDGTRYDNSIQHSSRITDFKFSKDANRIATASADKTARLWETQSALPLTSEINHPASVQSVTFHGESSLLTTTSNGSAYRWDVSAYEATGGYFTGPAATYQNRTTAIAWSSNNDELAIATANNYLHVYRNDGQLRFNPRRFYHSIDRLMFSNDTRLLVVLDALGQVHILNARDGSAVRNPTPPTDFNPTFKLSNQNDTLLVLNGTVLQTWHLYNPVTSPRVFDLPLDISTIARTETPSVLLGLSTEANMAKLSLESSNDDSALLTATKLDSDIKAPFALHHPHLHDVLVDANSDVYPVRTNFPFGAPITSHAAQVTSVSISPNGKHLATSSADRTVHLSDLETHQFMERLEWFGTTVHRVVFLTDRLLYIESEAKNDPSTFIRQIYDINNTKLVNLPPTSFRSAGVTPVTNELAVEAHVDYSARAPLTKLQAFEPSTGVPGGLVSISGDLVGLAHHENVVYALMADGRLFDVDFATSTYTLISKRMPGATGMSFAPKDNILLIYKDTNVFAFFDVARNALNVLDNRDSHSVHLISSRQDRQSISIRQSTAFLWYSLDSPFDATPFIVSAGLLNADFDQRKHLAIEAISALGQNHKAELRFDWLRQFSHQMPLSLAFSRLTALENQSSTLPPSGLVVAAINARQYHKAIALIRDTFDKEFSFTNLFMIAALLRLQDDAEAADTLLLSHRDRVSSASPADMLLFLNAAALSPENTNLHEYAFTTYANADTRFKRNVTVRRAAAMLAVRLDDSEKVDELLSTLKDVPNRLVLAPLHALMLSTNYLDDNQIRRNLARLANRLPLTTTHNLQQLSHELLLFELLYRPISSKEANP